MGMFTTAKPTASLSSSLLARKGQARPAMRPQGFVGSPNLSLEDLGWNDMGHDLPVEVPSVLREREALHEEFAPVTVEAEAPAAPEPLPAATVARIEREVGKKASKAAFTLRLDADRHLRLRLASAVRHQSAQMLVTEALDAFFESLPEVETLVRQLPPRADR
jgi:hypothetical protein